MVDRVTQTEYTRKASKSTGEIPSATFRKDWDEEQQQQLQGDSVSRVNFWRLSLEHKRKKNDQDKATFDTCNDETAEGSLEKELSSIHAQAATSTEPESECSPVPMSRKSIELQSNSHFPDHSVRFEHLRLNLERLDKSSDLDEPTSPNFSKRSPQKGILKSPGIARASPTTKYETSISSISFIAIVSSLSNIFCF